MTIQAETIKTPDEEVAMRIVTAFREQSLLSEKGLKKLADGLAQGNLGAEDWKFLFDADRPQKENLDGSQS
jgi:hypothetical protein